MSQPHDSPHAAIATTYKALKEDFVSNLTGGSIGEINAVTAVAPVAVLLWSVLQSRHGFFRVRHPVSGLVEFLLNVTTILLATTLYASQPRLLIALLLAPVPILYLLPAHRNRGCSTKPSHEPTPSRDGALHSLPKRSFLTNYRGTMLIITSLSILAVDFPIFPRRFAKVENWGTSLMDVGVGSFVFSAGIVAARPLLLPLAPETNVTKRLARAVRHSAPLFALGMIRLWSVKGLNYAEHVTEYGVHWNFFFTLGFLPPFVALCQSASKYIPSYSGLAIFLASLYQLILDATPLQTYIFTAPRTDLVSMNREGICSFVGYLAIFLAGHGTGLFVLPRHLGPSSLPEWHHRKQLLLTLCLWSILWTLLFLGCTHQTYGLHLTVSRRLANLPYVLWTAAFNTCHITAFCIVETIFFPGAWRNTARISKKDEEKRYRGATSRLLEAFNRNGLALFLVANLLTGAVNLTISTIEAETVRAMTILMAYSATLSGLALVLDCLDVSIKL
ncbi:GPI-anchored wall transfer protein 1 [Podosphaera aphanis]|nr:GPI-anchored wall transfer protein 1 [Podosphaera aphanis]